MQIQWLFKINFHLYVTSVRINSLLIYAYRKGLSSTVANLRDLRKNPPPHYLIIHSSLYNSLWLKISKKWEAPWWMHSLNALLCLTPSVTCFMHRGKGSHVLSSWLQNVSSSHHLGCHLPEPDISQITQSKCKVTETNFWETRHNSIFKNN